MAKKLSTDPMFQPADDDGMDEYNRVADAPPVGSNGVDLPPDDPFAPTPAGSNRMDEYIEIDMSDPRVTGIIPPGQYVAKVLDVEMTKSRNGDNMLVWTFQVIADFSSDPVKLYTVMTPNAFWKVNQVLSALSLVQPGVKSGFRPRDAVNKLCQIEIINEVYNGSTRSSVKTVLAPTAEQLTRHTRAMSSHSDIPF